MFMNTRQDILNNIKLQFKKMFSADEVPTCTFTTGDGKTIIVIGSDAGVGIEAYELSADGTQIPLTNGDYKLTDGRVLTITDNKISAIVLPDAPKADVTPAEEMADAPVAPVETPDEQATEDSTTKDLEDRVTSLESQINDLMNMIAPLLEQTQTLMSSQKEMFAKVQRIANEPDGEKIVINNKFAETEKTVTSGIESMKEKLAQMQFEKYTGGSGVKKPETRLDKIAALAKTMRKY